MSSHCFLVLFLVILFLVGLDLKSNRRLGMTRASLPLRVCAEGGVLKSLHVRVPAQERECADYLCIRVFSFLRSAVLRNRSSWIPSSVFLSFSFFFT